jgi:protein TonB
MAKPSLLCMAPINLSREAAAHGVSGVALIHCVVEVDGWLSQCRLAKSLPHMDDQLLAATTTMRFTPIMYRGHPQRVRMTIPIRVLPPPPRSDK